MPGTLGFYEYRKCLKCPVGGLSNSKVLATGEFPASIPSKQQIIGNIFHDLMDHASTAKDKDDILDYADTLIGDYEKNHSAFIKQNKLGKLESWSSVTNSIRTALNYNRQSKLNRTTKKAPITLRSPDDRFVGVPDKFYIDDSVGYIIEYKSTDIYVDGRLNEEYIEQVKFYSSLAHLNYPDLVKFNCKIKSLNGSTVDQIFSISELHLYYDEIVNNYLKITDRLRAMDMTFSEEICVFCDKSVVCTEFQKQSVDINSRNDIYIVSGRVTNAVSRGDVVHIQSDRFDLTIPGLRKQDICIGKIYTFYRLHKKNKDKLVWGTQSDIYEHE